MLFLTKSMILEFSYVLSCMACGILPRKKNNPEEIKPHYCKPIRYPD